MYSAADAWAERILHSKDSTPGAVPRVLQLLGSRECHGASAPGSTLVVSVERRRRRGRRREEEEERWLEGAGNGFIQQCVNVQADQRWSADMESGGTSIGVV